MNNTEKPRLSDEGRGFCYGKIPKRNQALISLPNSMIEYSPGERR